MSQVLSTFGVTTATVIGYVSRLKRSIGEPNTDLSDTDITTLINQQAGIICGVLASEGYNIATIAAGTSTVPYFYFQSLIARLSVVYAVKSIYEPQELSNFEDFENKVNQDVLSFRADPTISGIEPHLSKVDNEERVYKEPQAIREMNSTCLIEDRW